MVVIKPECTKPGISPAKQLAEHDDMCINLTIDVYLGFVTHKMSGRFRPIKANQGIIKQALSELKSTGNIEAAYRQIITQTGQWSSHYFLNKSRAQMDAFKDHVSLLFTNFLVVSFCDSLWLIKNFVNNHVTYLMVGKDACPLF